MLAFQAFIFCRQVGSPYPGGSGLLCWLGLVEVCAVHDVRRTVSRCSKACVRVFGPTPRQCGCICCTTLWRAAGVLVPILNIAFKATTILQLAPHCAAMGDKQACVLQGWGLLLRS